MRTLVLALLVASAAAVGSGCAAPDASSRGESAALSRAQIEAIVASPDRSEADRRNDVRRKPVEMLSFIGVRPGMVVLDVSAGGGYTSELLARAVAPSGRVYAQTPRPPGATLAARLATPAAARIVSVVQPFDNPVPADAGAGRFDLVTLLFNYHDFGAMGVDRARLNAAVFAALKPGGVYVVADHAGRLGTGISESATLHRVEEALVRREVEAAGFRLAAAGEFLRNPADPRDREEPVPPQPKDEFVLRFVKP
jgi:predicted methyltransferase